MQCGFYSMFSGKEEEEGGAGDGNQPSQLPTLPALRCSWGAERSRTRPSRRARLFREARNAFRDTEWERGEEAGVRDPQKLHMHTKRKEMNIHKYYIYIYIIFIIYYIYETLYIIHYIYIMFESG